MSSERRPASARVPALVLLLAPLCRAAADAPELLVRLDAHPPFQIDGNFGAAAGIAEMLLQSHDDAVRLLPALPSAWREGSVKGLRARGGFELDIGWREGKLTAVTLRSKLGGTCRLAYGPKAVVLKTPAGGSYGLDGRLAPPKAPRPNTRRAGQT